MAKKRMRIPKRIAGLKIPKAVRKSKLLRSLLGSPMGRTIVADALVAGAAAAAAALVREREEIADAAKAGTKKGARTVAVLSEAVQDAADAVMGVIADAARSLAPEDAARGKRRPRAPGADATRH
jgi:hypothetical protein